MKSLWFISPTRSRYGLAALAGVLLAAAFPMGDVAGLAWVAPGLLALVSRGRPAAERFRIGYVGGLAHYLALLYWLLHIPYRWQGIPIGPATGWLALGAFLALFPAAWTWMMGLMDPVPAGRSVEVAGGTELGTEFGGDRSEPVAGNPEPKRVDRDRLGSWGKRAAWAVCGAAVWVALEMLLARIFGGFPWALLGVSQQGLTPLIQIASVTGVYGVSFLVVWVSLSLASAGWMLIRRPSARSLWVGEVFVPVLVTAVVFNMGFRALPKAVEPARSVKMALIQPSIPQTLIWDPEGDVTRFEQLLRVTEAALKQPAEVVIWPEAAVPKMLRYDTNTFNAISELARRHRVWMIVGSDDAEPRRNARESNEADYFNSSFLVSPEGELVERYIKRSLVIFGEYVPLSHWLPFLKYFTPIQGGFTPGTGPVEFYLGSLDIRTSVLICFEDIFPHLARRDMRTSTDFLVNITNDGWFGESAAQWQHAFAAAFRAVENRVPLVRCSNNGLTCWFDAWGRMRELLLDEKGSVYGAGFLRCEVPVQAPGQKRALTFYARHGDWFGWSCAAMAGLVLAIGLWRHRRWSQSRVEVL